MKSSDFRLYRHSDSATHCFIVYYRNNAEIRATFKSLRPRHDARNTVTAVNAQERASTIPRLHRAKTVACGLLKWGKWAWMIMVHSVTRGWQDIGILLGRME